MPMKSEMVPKLIRLRYPGTCSWCSRALLPGSREWWDFDLRTTICGECHSGVGGSPAEVDPPKQVQQVAATPGSAAVTGVAGASARQVYEQKHRRREQQIDQRWGRLAGVVKFMSDDPQSTKAWTQGSEGERRLAADLTKRVGDRAVEHYNTHRPHRSLGQRAPSALATAPVHIGDVDLARLQRSDRLGSLIHEYRMVS
jgi:hypothetical protein